jgi:uncharacterized protein
MSEPRKPHFRFYPSAYEAKGVFKSSAEACGVCGEACGWRYTGNIYAIKHPEIVCAVCIASGRLRTHLGNMQLHDVVLDGAEAELERELLERTPGVSCFNPFAWPVVDGVPLAFIGYGDDSALQDIAAARDAVKRAGNECGIDDLEMPTPYALVFKTLDDERYEAAVDFD